MIKVAYHPIYVHPVPDNHRFPMEKYELLAYQLVYENIIEQSNFFEPHPIDEKLVLATHNATYYKRLLNLELTKREQRVSGFVHTNKLILRERIITQGTVMAAEYAFTNGLAFNIAGGTHHAYTDRGEGFCLLNDFAVAANHLLNTKNVKRILILDLDVHQGNGTAEIFQNDSRVFTFSMHGKNNYPLRKENSDLDINLPNNCNDEQYLSLLEANLKYVLNKHEPDIVFYQSGVDVLSTDKLGHLSLSLSGCRQRDQMVFEMIASKNLPICVAMGGGYSPQIKHILDAHTNTYRVASSYYS